MLSSIYQVISENIKRKKLYFETSKLHSSYVYLCRNMYVPNLSKLIRYKYQLNSLDILWVT